jgi:Resolvase, N terminal domain
MKQAALYAHVSTPDQHVEAQLYDLRKLVTQRSFDVSLERCDRGISGRKAETLDGRSGRSRRSLSAGRALRRKDGPVGTHKRTAGCCSYVANGVIAKRKDSPRR